MVIEIEGIVIRQVQYKEKDAMVSVLTKDGTVSFLARCILSPTSKNASSCLLFAYSNFTLNSKQDKRQLEAFLDVGFKIPRAKKDTVPSLVKTETIASFSLYCTCLITIPSISITIIIHQNNRTLSSMKKNLSIFLLL